MMEKAASSLPAFIEAVLFWKGEPMSVSELVKIFDSNPREIEEALKVLEENLSGRGLVLERSRDQVALGTAPEAGLLISKLTKEELSRDLGRAGAETVGIILYLAPVSKRDIEFIRGVNATYMLRALLVRGLIERIQSQRDQRVFLYAPTIELLSHLGIKRPENLPDYQKNREELLGFLESEPAENGDGAKD